MNYCNRNICVHMSFRVIPYCESKGWQRMYDKTREDYKLKWCELKAPRTYNSFRAGHSFATLNFNSIASNTLIPFMSCWGCDFFPLVGEQLVYQIPNNKVLTTKIGLLNSLREYDRVCSKVKRGQGLRSNTT